MMRVIVAVLLALTLACAREGHVLEADGMEQPPMSAAESARMCDEAFIALKGAQRDMSADQVHALLVRTYGRPAADALRTSIGPRRAVVLDDALFLHTSALCKVPNLPARCRDACRITEEIGTAPR